MTESLITELINASLAMPPWEVAAALLGACYIILAAKESQWCWPFAFANTLIYTVLFWEGQLPMQALLNAYYMAMAVYGYMIWRKHQQSEDNIHITSWSWSKQVVFIVIGTVLSLITAYYLQSNQLSQSPYLDASVTIFSVMNTWLMARKVLQNWIYWIIIDAAAVVLYFETAYYATVILFALYIVLAISGLISWQKRFKQQVGQY
ncbi:nicotinamide mononucleotide transporter [Methylophaga sp. 41_12_T18]|nr:nicotinamide mononucleotide transporter [Methylophaga sp. 41_12_T18]